MAITPEEAWKLLPAEEQQIAEIEHFWDQQIRALYDGTPLKLKMPGGLRAPAQSILQNKYEMAGWDVKVECWNQSGDYDVTLTKKPSKDIREASPYYQR